MGLIMLDNLSPGLFPARSDQDEGQSEYSQPRVLGGGGVM